MRLMLVLWGLLQLTAVTAIAAVFLAVVALLSTDNSAVVAAVMCAFIAGCGAGVLYAGR